MERGYDPTLAKRRVLSCAAAGMSAPEMAKQSRVSERTIRNLMNDAVPRNMYRRTFIALMELQPVAGRRLVPAIGTLRKVEALATMGWSRAEIARRAGISDRTLITQNLGGFHNVHASTAEAVDAVYQHLKNQVAPPSHRTRWVMRSSRSRGYAPPWLWSGSSIDAVDSIVDTSDLWDMTDRAWARAISERWGVPLGRKPDELELDA